MDGAELALLLTEMRPSISIIFMSGYSEGPELRPEKFRNVNFSAKPFTSMALSSEVRQALDMRRSELAASWFNFIREDRNMSKCVRCGKLKGELEADPTQRRIAALDKI